MDKVVPGEGSDVNSKMDRLENRRHTSLKSKLKKMLYVTQNLSSIRAQPLPNIRKLKLGNTSYGAVQLWH